MSELLRLTSCTIFFLLFVTVCLVLPDPVFLISRMQDILITGFVLYHWIFSLEAILYLAHPGMSELIHLLQAIRPGGVH